MTGPSDDSAAVVDARGTRCPVPVIRLARAARGHADGDRLVLLADDVAARADVPAWGRLRGHTVQVTDPDVDGVTTYHVVLGANQADRST